MAARAARIGARALLLSPEDLDYRVVDSDARLRDGLGPSGRLLKRSGEDSERAIFGFRRP